jgi:hypothetical protein
MEHYKLDRRESRDHVREEAYLRAKKKLEKIKGFYWHLAAYIVVNGFIIISVFLNLDEGQRFWRFGTFTTAAFWGIGLLFHFMGVFGTDYIFGKRWEDRKIQEYMDKDKRKWE